MQVCVEVDPGDSEHRGLWRWWLRKSELWGLVERM